MKLAKEIQIDNKLNFETHIKYLCSKASQKLGALQRFSVRCGKEKSSVQHYNKTSFQLMPTGLDVLPRRSNSLVNNVLQRALRIVSDDHNNSNSELLMTKKEHTIHQQNMFS